MENLQHNIWITKTIYEQAEKEYYENLAKASVTPLAGEVAKARQLLIESRDSFKNTPVQETDSVDPGSLKFLEKKTIEFEKTINKIVERLERLEFRVATIDTGSVLVRSDPFNINVKLTPEDHLGTHKLTMFDDENVVNDDVDLFGSDSEEENEAAAKLREERLAAYNAKKSKKPTLIAKSNLILDVKPWDDETDMEELEKQVRTIATPGLLWGASKLVPLAYGIFKLQISCVVEDEQVSIDWLQEKIAEFEDYVQSVDIAAFNKI